MSLARDRLLLDIFITAMEGGINYWHRGVLAYHWEFDDGSDLDGTEDLRGFYADIEFPWWEDGVEVLPHAVQSKIGVVRIDRHVISRGYGKAFSSEWRDRLCWSSSKPPMVAASDEDWDYDAGDADMVVQLGLFGDVVYG